MLERRLTRLENKLKIPREERHVCEGSLAKSEANYIEGVRIHHAASALVLDKNLKIVGTKTEPLTQPRGLTQTPLPWTQRRVSGEGGIKPEVRWQVITLDPGLMVAYIQKSMGKSIWIGRNNEEVTVENLALQHYEDLGFKGYDPILFIISFSEIPYQISL